MLKSFLFTLSVFCLIHTSTGQTDSSQFYYKKGVVERKARRYMVAANYFDKAIHFDPKNVEAYIENGQVNLEMRRIDAAQGNFTKANALQPNNTAISDELASLYFNNRQFQKAIDLAQKCSTCPNRERIIAMSYYSLEDYAKAVPGLQRALTKKPDDADVSYTLARAYLEMEDYKKAIPAYQKAISLDASKGTWMYELGLIFYNKNALPEALKYFKMAEGAGYIKSNDFYENIGFAYLNTGDIENGMKNLTTVLSRKPRNKELLTDIAQAMFTAKKYDDALVYYQKLLELDAKDANALYMAGMTFQRKGMKERGQQMCDQAIKLDPSLSKNRQKKNESFGL